MPLIMQLLQQNKCLMYQSGQPAASDIHNILNRVNEEISMYNDFDIENVKIALPKVYEIFFSAKCLLKQPFSEKTMKVRVALMKVVMIVTLHLTMSLQQIWKVVMPR